MDFDKLIIPETHNILYFNSVYGKKLFAIYQKNRTCMRTIINNLKQNYSFTKPGKDCDFYLKVPILHKYLYADDFKKTPEQLGLNSKTIIDISHKLDNSCKKYINYDKYYQDEEFKVNQEYKKKEQDAILTDKQIANKMKKSANLQIFIKTLTGRTYTIDVANDLNGLELKYLVQQKTGVPLEEMFLCFGGRLLDNHKTLTELNIIKESTLHLLTSSRGGMFHETSGKNGNYQPLEDCMFYVPADDE